MPPFRIQHRIKALETTSFPNEVVFFDTETKPIKVNDKTIIHKLWFGIALYWRNYPDRKKDTLEWFRFERAGELWEWILGKVRDKRRLVVVAHNITFDFITTRGFEYLDESGYKVNKAIFDHCRFIMTFKNDKKTILVLDNMNYFKTSLQVLGEGLKLEKLTMPEYGESQDVWDRYCKRDVEVLYKAWCEYRDFIIENDLGSFGLTIASQAFNAYRKRFMRLPIFIHTSKKALALERLSYKGGRVECFRLGKQKKQDYYCLDVNSMYPAVMSEFSYPTNLISTGTSASLSRLSEWLDTYAVIARVRIETTFPVYGVRMNDKLLFPIGSFETTLTTQELLLGLERGLITEILDYALYERGAIFRGYVDYMYNLRKKFSREERFGFSLMAKYLLNSLYGKFGQKIISWKSLGESKGDKWGYWTEVNAQSNQVYTYRIISGLVQVREDYQSDSNLYYWNESGKRIDVYTGQWEGFNSFTAIAAEVTANARLRLLRLIEQAGWNNVFYVDTDSLIVNGAGYKNLQDEIDPDRLGALKLEDRSNHLILHNAKDYELGDKIRIKGVRKNAEQIEDDTYRQFQSASLAGMIHTGEVSEVKWVTVDKVLKRHYEKGEIKKGGTVTPFILHD